MLGLSYFLTTPVCTLKVSHQPHEQVRKEPLLIFMFISKETLCTVYDLLYSILCARFIHIIAYVSILFIFITV